MKEFRLQPKILFGEDSLDYLKTLEYKKVMIVTDEVMTQLKLTDFVTNSLSSTTEIKIFDKVEPNPSMQTIENGLKDFIDFEPQCVIALGGGSPIDACKAILYFSYELYKKLKVNKKVFFIALEAFAQKYSKKEIFKTLQTFYKRFFSQQFKRSCSADGADVTGFSLSPRTAWCMASDSAADLWLKELETLSKIV